MALKFNSDCIERKAILAHLSDISCVNIGTKYEAKIIYQKLCSYQNQLAASSSILANMLPGVYVARNHFDKNSLLAIPK